MADTAKPDLKPAADEPRRVTGNDDRAEVDTKPPGEIAQPVDGNDDRAEVDRKVDDVSKGR